jgi:hypothetical protein
MAINTFIFGGFCLVIPTIILVVLIITLRGKGNDGLAILSLVSSILGFFLLPIVGSIAAVVAGNIALNQYKDLVQANNNQGLLQPNNNQGMARAGVILGWIGLGIWIVGVVGVFLFLVPYNTITTSG